MSARLSRLRETLPNKTRLHTDEEKIRWLNRQCYVRNDSTERAEWIRLLNRLARAEAAKRTLSPVDAWFHVTEALAASVADPEDNLYGVTLAVIADTSGVSYADLDLYLRLIAGYKKLYDEFENKEMIDANEAAYDLFEFVLCRLEDVETALKEPLESDEFVSAEMLADPDVVVAGSTLMCDAIADHAEYHANNGLAEMDGKEIDAFIEYGGHFFWACYHARRFDVERDELTRFVCVYTHEWFDLMNDLLRRDLLAPGVLDALVDTDGSFEAVVERGAELVASFRSVPPTDMTLAEYLNCCLIPVETNA